MTHPSRSIISRAAMNRVKLKRQREILRNRQRGIITLRLVEALSFALIGFGLIGFFVVWAGILGLLP